ncbi:MAG: glycosyltransferase [Bacteroidetes bacterium]|jgi:glycosyltransferase involved in cell wall biosynthesis|nr:glycosyltransferase [Bacteroidota bacterium]
MQQPHDGVRDPDAPGNGLPLGDRALPEDVGFVHDWLPVYAGAERVLKQMIEVLPAAKVYTLVDLLAEDERSFLQGTPVETSFIQRMPFVQHAYRYYLPFAPLAVEQFDVSDHDVVVSSSYAVAKGALTRSDQLHISYVHSPIRYAWDLYHDYLDRGNGVTRRLRNLLARPILHYMRMYDVCSAPRVDLYVANSNHVARRIWKRYRRKAHVIYPPVDIDRFSVESEKQDYFVALSRLVHYKHVDVVIRAFNEMPDKKLIVIGDGPERERLDGLAGPNVDLLGHQPDAAVTHYLQQARALVFAAEEDFGIVPVEAQACGTPVIAYGRGGVTETVRAGATGMFFDRQEPDAVRDAVRHFDRRSDAFKPKEIREQAERFDVETFRSRFSNLVRRAYGAAPMTVDGAGVRDGVTTAGPIGEPTDRLL